MDSKDGKMERTCPYCQKIFSSIYAKDLHLATVHAKYEDGTDIATRTQASIERTRDQTIYLLLNYRECRNPKPKWIWTKWLQIFSHNHILVYDESHRGWMVNKPEGVLKAEDIDALFSALESVRRRKQELQEADKDMYHMKDEDGHWITIEPHNCILTNEKDLALADVREQVIHDYYADRLKSKFAE